jgi:hypothetical protein
MSAREIGHAVALLRYALSHLRDRKRRSRRPD